jgi:hypothetical protein
MARKLPSTVKVGYRTLRIELWCANEAADNDALAFFSPNKGLIKIREGLDHDETRNCLLHEVMHACWYIGHLEARPDEETAVSVLTNQLTQVLADNPAVARFLTEASS